MKKIFLSLLVIALLGVSFFAGRMTAPSETITDAGLADILPADLIGAINDEEQREKLLQIWSQTSQIVTDSSASFAIENPVDSPFPETFPASPFFGVKAAPADITFPDTSLIQGGEVLEAAKDGWVVMNVWASWCAPCIAELPDIAEAIQALEGEEVSIHVVNADPLSKDTAAGAADLMAQREAETIPFMFVEGKKDIRAFLRAIFEDPDRTTYPYNIIYAPGGVPFAVFAGGPTDGREVWGSAEGLTFLRALTTLDAELD